MTAVQEPLFPPGWERQEPDGDERAFTDLHGPQPRTRLSPRRGDRDVETVTVPGRWL